MEHIENDNKAPGAPSGLNVGLGAAEWLQRMRTCSPLLPPPGGDVVCELLDEIERMRGVFRKLRNGLHCGHAPADMIADIEEVLVNGA